MSNWIDSGGDVPRLFAGDDGETSDLESAEGRRTGRWKMLLTIGFAVLLLGLASQLGHARDRGQYANANPELKAWFEGLKSGKGPCCSDADGTAVSDVDWESGNGHYRVRLDGEWVDVPTTPSSPNRTASAEPWFGQSAMASGVYIRCFMPGSMT